MLADKHLLMPKESKRRKQSPDVASNAVRVMRVATGQINDAGRTQPIGKSEAAAALGRLGGKARAKSLNAAQRVKIAKKAAQKRWHEPNELS